MPPHVGPIELQKAIGQPRVVAMQEFALGLDAFSHGVVDVFVPRVPSVVFTTDVDILAPGKSCNPDIAYRASVEGRVCRPYEQLPCILVARYSLHETVGHILCLLMLVKGYFVGYGSNVSGCNLENVVSNQMSVNLIRCTLRKLPLC